MKLKPTMKQPSRDELIDRIAEGLDGMSKLRRARYRDDLAGFDMTMPQIRTLSFLNQLPKRMKEISEYLGRGMPSATSMIDRLVKKNYVERVEDSSDRRVVICQITELGRDMLDRFSRIGTVQAEAIAESLSDDDLSSIAPALDILVDAMARQTESSDNDTDPSDGKSRRF